MKIPKPKHGRMYLVTQVAAVGSAALAIGGMFFGNHADGVAYLALTLGWLTAGRVLLIEQRTAQPGPVRITDIHLTPEQLTKLRADFDASVRRESRWV